MSTQLLAKSNHGGGTPQPEITLTGHTSCVLAAAGALFGSVDSPSPLSEPWLRFFKLARTDFERFLKHLRVAAAAHDWGKANDGFQDAVTRQGEQVIRHEHLSAMLLADRFADHSTSSWFQAAGLDELIVLAAVVSHHVKSAERGDEHVVGALGGKRDSFRLCVDHEDFAAIWRALEAEVGSPCPTSVMHLAHWRKEDIRAKAEALNARLRAGKRRLRGDRLLAAVRSGLIAADAVGSAVVRMGRSGTGPGEGVAESTIADWVGACFGGPIRGDDIWTKVIEPRIAQLRDQGRWRDEEGRRFNGVGGFKQFQCEVPAFGPRVLMEAGCGSGKTLAAWNWIKSQLDSLPAGRVLFLYPTRATATEGFRDYVSWAPEAEAGLLSGTAAYELRDMFENPAEPASDSRKGKSYGSDPRLFALGHWTKRIFSATADQFFPFMQFAYGPLCLLPVLADAVLVVDEVHSYDGSMFSTLRRFLVEFPSIPVLCMTATLPATRRDELVRDCGLRPYPETPPPDLLEDTNHPRYRVEWVDRGAAKGAIREELNAGKRVLWVSNRVSDCQAVFEDFRDDGSDDHAGVSAFCYHSRFKLAHRQKRHAELIRAFQDAARDESPQTALFGSTTQVCEMSLDLDAEVLVTELAPITSLIQRMGRCNRDSETMKRKSLIGLVYVLRPEAGKEKPYEPEDLATARRFVDAVAGPDVSQAKLEQAFKECDPGEVEFDRLCPFLDSGPYAKAREESFREIDEFTIPCVLDKDVQKVLDKLRDRDPKERIIDGLMLPVPRRLAKGKQPQDALFPRWLSVSTPYVYEYDAEVGFVERPRPETEGSES